MPMFRRNASNGFLQTFTPSTMIEPCAGSKMRNKASAIDDFPAPVLPTIPTFQIKHRLPYVDKFLRGLIFAISRIFRLFAKINPREKFRISPFAKINPREIF